MWNERYNTEEHVYGTEPNQFLAENMSKLPKGRVLSLAEGEGRNAVYLAQNGYEVIGVDSSSVGLQKAKKLAEQNGVSIQTVVADLAEFEIPPASFDCIISIFGHVPKGVRISLHKRVFAGLKPGGVFLLEAYTPEQLNYGTGGPPTLDRLVSLDELKNDFKELKINIAREIEREVVEGKLHTGKAAVVQFIGYKK